MYLNTVPDRYGQTDRRTDRQTDGRLTVASPHSALASRGKNVKNHVFGFWKKRQKRKNVQGHLITQPLITQLPEVSTGKSRSPTSNILLRSADTRNYETGNCVW